jgi:hypothetical protein
MSAYALVWAEDAAGKMLVRAAAGLRVAVTYVVPSCDGAHGSRA